MSTKIPRDMPKGTWIKFVYDNLADGIDYGRAYWNGGQWWIEGRKENPWGTSELEDMIVGENWSEDNPELPTEEGSVIGWSTFYDGNHFSVWVLSQGDLPAEEWQNPGEDGLRWWQAGSTEALTSEELKARLGNHWQYMGKIKPVQRTTRKWKRDSESR